VEAISSCASVVAGGDVDPVVAEGIVEEEQVEGIIRDFCDGDEQIFLTEVVDCGAV
jgi:hypothetical protein